MNSISETQKNHNRTQNHLHNLGNINIVQFVLQHIFHNQDVRTKKRSKNRIMGGPPLSSSQSGWASVCETPQVGLPCRAAESTGPVSSFFAAEPQ